MKPNRGNYLLLIAALAVICSICQFIALSVKPPAAAFFETASLILTAIVGAVLIVAHLIKKAKAKMERALQQKPVYTEDGYIERHDIEPDQRCAEFVILCDDALTIVKDDEILDAVIDNKGGPRIELPESMASFVHPDDMDMLREKVRECSLLSAFHCDLRLVEEPYQWTCRCRGIQCPMKDMSPDRRSVKIAFSLLEHEKFSDSKCHDLLESFSAAVWEYDIQQDILQYSPVSAQDEVFSMRGNAFLDFMEESLIVHPDFKRPFKKLRESVINGVEDIYVELKLLDTKNNDYRWHTLTGRIQTDENGKVLSYMGELRNTDTSAENAASVKSDRDSLTGLFNRHGMERLVSSRLKKGLNSSALILIDIDDFVSINNRMGRHFSDALLIDVAGVLRGFAGPGDVVSRINRDIFAIFLENPKSKNEVHERALRLGRVVGHCYLNVDRTENVTCCMGIAYCSMGDLNYEQLYYQADTALAVAKTGGVKRIEFYREEMDYMYCGESEQKEEISNLSELSGAAESHAAHKSSDLLSKSIDVLFDSRELSSSINIVLSLIGHKYGLEMAEIVEFSDDYHKATCTYQWNSGYISEARTESYPISVIEEAILLDADAEYFVCSNDETFAQTHPDVARMYSEKGVEVVLQIPVRDGIRISGLICYGCKSYAVVFRPEVIHELVLISKIIAGYITRLRDQNYIDRLSNLDVLTGCMNLSHFIVEARRIVRENPHKRFAVLCTDIDRFKIINETFGYLAGDNVLIEFSKTAMEMLGPYEIMGRVGADRFVVLMEYTGHERLLKRLNSIDKQVNLRCGPEKGYKIPVRCGICYPSYQEEITSTIDKANIARKSIKNIHVSQHVFFDEAMKSKIVRQREIENVMYDALERGEFEVYLQPKFRLSDNTLSGAEALVRWNRPGYGLLKPDEFIPIFEENGFVVNLDFHVMECICRKLRSDIDRGLEPYPISVNFSRVHLNKKGFIEVLKSYIDKYSLPPKLVEIEITESALVGNEDYLVEILSKLHEIGVMVSMDDFGSGYSTLNLLKKFPVDVLKIDKAFMAGNGSERDRLIIANVVNMAKALKMRVISEGVETKEQAEFLRSINCDMAQGYLYARPMSVQAYESTYQLASEKQPVHM